MATLGSLIISLEANTAKFEAAMNKATYTAKKSSDAIKGSLMAIGTALVGAFSISAIESMIKSVASSESALLKMAGRLNTNVETLSSFGVMVRKTGMDSDAFYLALTRLEKGMSAAGMKALETASKFDDEGEEIMKTSGAYDQLGLNVAVLMKMPLDQQLMAIAEAFKTNIDPADRVNIAMQLFGRSGAGMINVLKGGAAEIQNWQKEQQNLGLITTENAKKASEFSGAVKNLESSWQSLVRTFAEAVIPGLAEVAGEMASALMKMREFQSTKNFISSTFGEKAAYGFAKLGASKAGTGPFGEAAESFYPPIPYKPPKDLTKPPIKPGSLAAGGGGGGKGGRDTTEQLEQYIRQLQEELSKAADTGFGAVNAWYDKTIAKIATLATTTEQYDQAMGIAQTVNIAKTKNVTDEFNKWYLSQTYQQTAVEKMELDKRAESVRGHAEEEAKIREVTGIKIQERQNELTVELAGKTRQYLDSLSGLTGNLDLQNDLKQRSLELEQKINDIELKRWIRQKEVPAAMADTIRALAAFEAQAKKTDQARKSNEDRGTLTGWASSRVRSDQTGKRGMAGILDGGEKFFQDAMSAGIQGVLTKDANKLRQVGSTMVAGFVSELHKKSVTSIFSGFAKMMAPKDTAAGGVAGGVATGGVADPIQGAAKNLNQAATGLQASALGFNLNSAQFGLAAGGLLLSGLGIATNSEALVIAGTVLQVAAIAIQMYQMIAATSLTGAAAALTTSAGALVAAAAVEAVPFFHSGGLIKAHSGYLANDERMIVVQTGERVLDRDDTREYDAGRGRGKSSATVNYNNIQVSIPNQSQAEIDRFARRLSKSLRRQESRRIA